MTHLQRLRTTAAAAIILGGIALITSCSKSPTENEVKSILAPVKHQFAPDARLAVFEVTADATTHPFILRGDVGSIEARDAVLKAFADAGYSSFLDSINVLPLKNLEFPYAIVTVSAANLRAKPSESAELVTQVTMGMTLTIMKQRSGWFYVQAPDDYLGWIDDGQTEPVSKEDMTRWSERPKVIVTDYFAVVRADAGESAPPVCDAVAGNILGLEGSRGRWYKVSLADGRVGYVPSSSAREFRSWLNSIRLTEDAVESTARMFLGVPYLWGGTSPKGVDCSGFTKVVYRLNGKELLRDADMQATVGEPVELDSNLASLKKGDLVFFSPRPTTDPNPRITHVGIYLGNKMIIHSSSKVKLNSFDPASPLYSKSLRERLVKARRIITDAKVPEVKFTF